ncbi:MAG: T9SS type A sorting domain-containing protein, partial [Chitinophagaceae bacterium]
YGVAANTNIRFALAKTDPDGAVLAQPGIDRIQYSTKGFTVPPYSVGMGGTPNYLNNTIKPATIWDPEKYINIWVLPLDGGVLGIATFPTSSGLDGLSLGENASNAGVAVTPETIGSLFAPNGCGNYGKGRTLTHELGHFFGLRHIWGDASCGTDYCEDTPTHQDENSGVPTHPKANACGTADEMFENFMDYSDDVVTNTFTANQVARMQTVLTASPRRSALKTSPVATVPLAASNRLAFSDCSGLLQVTETGLEGTTSRYRDYTFVLNVEDKATGPATVTINPAGTATNGFHYQVLTPQLVFADGDQYKNVTVRVFDNALAEGARTIELGYSISGTGVASSTNAQKMTITLLDDDNTTVAQGRFTVLSQNWEVSATGWDPLRSAAEFPNRFTVSSNGDAGGSGNAAHITNNTTTRVNQYDKDVKGFSLLRSPLINASGLYNMTLSFKYKVWGENYEDDDAYDFGALAYATESQPTSFFLVNSPAAGPYAGTTGIVSGTATVNLSNTSFANRRFHLGWYWENDDSEGNDPGLNIDDIVLTATGTPVETTVSTSYRFPVLPGSGANFFRSTNNRAIAQLTNSSASLAGVMASVTEAGNGQVAVTTSKGSFQRTQKVFRITPSAATTAAYRVTLYFTQAELAAWGNNKLALKMLKVKDGTPLNTVLNSTNAVLVTPVSATEDAQTGVIAYTADFTDGFSQYVLVSQNFVLPVNLVSFEAKPVKKEIELTWKTASESANKGFDIERSTNGIDYRSIGWADGAGTTGNAVSYRFTDRQVQPNVLYHYRLRQVDLDNNARYSEIRQAMVAATGITVSVSPNPVNNNMKLFVTGSTGPVDISMVNSKGQTVARWRAVNAAGGYEVNVAQLSKGTYTVVAHLPGGPQSIQVVLQ